MSDYLDDVGLFVQEINNLKDYFKGNNIDPINAIVISNVYAKLNIDYHYKEEDKKELLFVIDRIKKLLSEYTETTEDKFEIINQIKPIEKNNNMYS